MRRTYTVVATVVAALVVGLVGALPVHAVGVHTVTARLTTPGGTALSGVALTLTGTGSDYEATATTDGVGSATFVAVPEGSSALSGSVPVIGGEARQVFQAVAVTDDASVTVTVAGTRAVSGTVRDAASKAGIPAARVYLNEYDDFGTWGAGQWSDPDAVTDAGGAYRAVVATGRDLYVWAWTKPYEMSGARPRADQELADLTGVDVVLSKLGDHLGESHVPRQAGGASVGDRAVLRRSSRRGRERGLRERSRTRTAGSQSRSAGHLHGRRGRWFEVPSHRLRRHGEGPGGEAHPRDLGGSALREHRARRGRDGDRQGREPSGQAGREGVGERGRHRAGGRLVGEDQQARRVHAGRARERQGRPARRLHRWHQGRHPDRSRCARGATTKIVRLVVPGASITAGSARTSRTRRCTSTTPASWSGVSCC